MKVTKATQIGTKWACKHFTQDQPPVFKYAYNVLAESNWLGVVLFRETDGNRIDKWADQVAEMVVAVSGDKEQAVSSAIEALQIEAPWIDAVLCREQYNGFACIGEFGEGKKGAYIINGERLNEKTVKERGWRRSVLWLRENVDDNAKLFERDASALFVRPLVETMRKRIRIFN